MSSSFIRPVEQLTAERILRDTLSLPAESLMPAVACVYETLWAHAVTEMSTGHQPCSWHSYLFGAVSGGKRYYTESAPSAAAAEEYAVHLTVLEPQAHLLGVDRLIALAVAHLSADRSGHLLSQITQELPYLASHAKSLRLLLLPAMRLKLLDASDDCWIPLWQKVFYLIEGGKENALVPQFVELIEALDEQNRQRLCTEALSHKEADGRARVGHLWEAAPSVASALNLRPYVPVAHLKRSGTELSVLDVLHGPATADNIWSPTSLWAPGWRSNLLAELLQDEKHRAWVAGHHPGMLDLPVEWFFDMCATEEAREENRRERAEIVWGKPSIGKASAAVRHLVGQRVRAGRSAVYWQLPTVPSSQQPSGVYDADGRLDKSLDFGYNNNEYIPLRKTYTPVLSDSLPRKQTIAPKSPQEMVMHLAVMCARDWMPTLKAS